MDQRLVSQLVAINREFYSKFADAFSETRSSAQTRLERIVAYIGDDVKALDVGCGNGRLAERLEREHRRVQYVGVDAAPELIRIARAHNAQTRFVAAEFFVGNLAQRDWHLALPRDAFDVVVMLAVLHHLPSFELRATILREARALLKPGGKLILTNWQFAHNERQQKRLVPWETIGLAARDLEPGDALLAWKRGGVGFRFCHLITKDEMRQMAEQTGFSVLKQFFADADLNLYSVLEKS